jgi:hypothetical protein
MLALLGRDTLLRGIDAVQDRLSTLRTMVEAGDAEALENAFANTAQARTYWIVEARERIWDIERGPIQGDSLFQRTLKSLLGEAVTGKGK